MCVELLKAVIQQLCWCWRKQMICITAHSFLLIICHRLCMEARFLGSASLRCCYRIHTDHADSGAFSESGKAGVIVTLDLCHYPPTTSQGRQSRDQGRPGEILSPDIKKDARCDLSPHCQEFNFTQLTSARDKWNINNVTHAERGWKRLELFSWRDTAALTHPLITTMTHVPNVPLSCFFK